MGIFSNQYTLVYSRISYLISTMISKVFYVALLAACTQAQYHNHQATSSASYNQHQNTVHHIQSAPTQVKTVAAPLHAYSAPHSQASSYSSLSQGGPSASHYTFPIASQHAAPALHYAAPVAKIAAPVLLKAAAPAHHASSYSSLSIGHSAPAAHHFAPVASVSKIVAAPVAYATPAVHYAPAVHSAPAAHHHQEEYAHPKYEFAYGVEDHHTGDFHSHKEVRDGDVTQGEYSLHEADGTIRTVKYTVDKHSGFNAVVERTGHATHAQAAPAKAIVAAPSYGHYHH